jgi:CTP:molybdopterin cytidylyltransferase MocA
MGAFKAALPVDGIPAVTRIIRTFAEAGIEDIAVVSGYKREVLAEHIRGAAEVFNAGFDAGMFSSVQAGVTYFADRGFDAAWLTPVDCALISVPEVSAPDRIVISTYCGQEGHPVLLPSSIFPNIIGFCGSGGLRRLLEDFRELIVYAETGNIGTLLDMDTPGDYAEMQRRSANQRASGNAQIK